jgi:pyruvate/2-oxoglutarate dehydrogenase complex dihydrolipoamide acyltransferase (E2) component
VLTACSFSTSLCACTIVLNQPQAAILAGVAVGLDEGIVAPVIHDADEKSIIGLACAVDDLVQRGRTNRLTLQVLQGGTFTVNNVGVFGVVTSTPVINPAAGLTATRPRAGSAPSTTSGTR